MGACGVTLSYPGKTLEQARKLFGHDQEQDRYENGHCYSGGPGMLDNCSEVSSHIFDTVEDFEDAWERKPKNYSFWAQVRVIRETKPLIEARKAYYTSLYGADLARGKACAGGKGRVKGKDGQYKEGTAAQIKRVLDKHAKVEAKYRLLLAMQVAKSKKTTWYVGGWASS